MNLPFALDGRRVLVTGASSGLGRAAALMVAHAGGQVIATGRDHNRLAETRAQLPATPEGVADHCTVAADLCESGDVDRLVASLQAIDGLVLAAGVAQVAPLRYTDARVVRRILAINLESRLQLCQSLTAARRWRDDASIVFVSSLSVSEGVKGHAAYAASMAANEGASRAIAAELIGRRIRSNVVSPGLVRTPVLDDGEITTAQLDAMIARYPLGLGKPEDVAATILFLLSPASRWLTGQVLRLDGGYTLDA